MKSFKELVNESKTKKLDKVGKEDADVDNDGDVDASDKYLSNRRKAISKNINEAMLSREDKRRYDTLQRKLAELSKERNAAKKSGSAWKIGSKKETEFRDVKSQMAKLESSLNESFEGGKVKLSDGSTVNVSKDEADILNKFFDDLEPANKKKMHKIATSNKKGFSEVLNFAKEV